MAGLLGEAQCIVVEGLSKIYPGGRVAIRGVSLRVPCGSLVAVLGPNGSGKSTLLASVAGVVRPTKGRVLVLGRDPWGGDGVEARRLLGYVAQYDGFYPQLTGWENLALHASLHGAGLDRGFVKELAERLGLGVADLGRRVGSYSGGMRRKLSIIAALLHRPRVLVLDEPDSGVDPASRRRLLSLLRGLTSSGVGVLYATHIGASGEEADHVVFMYDGKVVDEGSPRGLVERYASSIVVELVVRDVDGFVDSARGLGMEYVRVRDRERVVVGLHGDGEAVAGLARLASRYGLEWMEVRRPGLEDAFLAATGSGLGGE